MGPFYRTDGVYRPVTSGAPGELGGQPGQDGPAGAGPRGRPGETVLVRPGVDRDAVLDEVEQPRLPDVRRREGVQGPQPRQDHAVVDEPPGVVLGLEELGDADSGQRILDRQDVAQGQEQVGAAPARVAERAARGPEP